MTTSKKILSICCAGLLAFASVAAHADTFTFATPAGATTSGAVDATATVVTGAGTVTITLTDLEPNPGNVAQLISDFDFVLSNGAKTGTLTSSSATQITVNGNGSSTVDNHGNAVSTGWGLNDNIGGGLQLDALGYGGPADLIIGPGPYSNANSSIAGNGPHNPFLDGTATFDLSVAGVTADTSVTGATFSFGTTAGTDVTGVPTVPTGVTPEPSSLILLGTGVVGLAGALRRRISASKLA